MKIILLAAISADGKIAESANQRSLDWTSKEDLKFFVEKTKEVGTLIVGRKTYETIGKPLKGRRMIVMSRLLPLTKGEAGRGSQGGLAEGTVEFTQDAPKELLFRLSQEGCESVVIAGGSSIYSQFLKAGLVTDVYLTIEPVLFGEGVSFTDNIERINMKLVEVSRLGEDAVLFHYKIE